MNPEKKIIPIKEETSEKGAESPKAALSAPGFVIKYGLILLGVAFFLVFLSYLSHIQQGNQQQLAELQKNQTIFSVSAMQSIESLQQENADLKDDLEKAKGTADRTGDALSAALAELSQLRDQLAATQDELAQSEKAAQSAATVAKDKTVALEYLWRLERLVSTKRYTKARALIEEMQGLGLVALLSDAEMPNLEPEGVTPAEEFARIVEVLS